MKGALLVVTCAFLLAAGARADEEGSGSGRRSSRGQSTPEETAQKETDAMKTSLGLSERQVPRVYEINLVYATKSSEARKAGLSHDNLRRRLGAAREQRDRSLKLVLTGAQYKLFMGEGKKKRHHGGGGGGEGGGDGGGDGGD